jgi:hypothetical protein
VLGSNDKSTAACELRGPVDVAGSDASKYTNRLTPANRIFAREIKKAADFATFLHRAFSSWQCPTATGAHEKT